MSKKSPKTRQGIVYSTKPDFNYAYNEIPETVTLPLQQQNLIVQINIKHRMPVY